MLAAVLLLGASVALLAFFAAAAAARAQRQQLALSAWPALPWLYFQALVSAAANNGKKPRRSRGEAAAPPLSLEVSLVSPTHMSAVRLRRYMRLVGYEDGTASVPLMYPIVESFRLVMQSMLLPAFPFSVLGSVLARNTSTLYRSLSPDERLVYRCFVDPAFRTTAKGDTEVDVTTTAAAVSAAATGSGGSTGGGALVWRNTTTEDPAAGLVQLDEWKLGPDTGRKYGALNGDLNPIHLYPATSALFGFKRPIAHALFLTAKAEMSLRTKAGVEALLSYPATLQAEFKRPTLLPAVLRSGWYPPADGDARGALQGPAGLRFAALTHDGKEVLVGTLKCGV